MKKKWLFIVLVFLTGCEGVFRDCSSMWASNIAGADWIVVQYNLLGEPVFCWQLSDVGVTSESSSDGIYWKGDSGMVHLSGHYNYVQVANGAYGDAARNLGINANQCVGGRYHP